MGRGHVVSERVVVFIDYQNVYRRGRDAFFDHDLDGYQYGQVDPVKLAQHLVDVGRGDRVLKEVRVYRGIPTNKRDPKGYAAARRQLSVWDKSAPTLTYITRELRYSSLEPGGYQGPPQEKGIDVALAVDFAVMAARKEYDVGVLFSVDTDLKPAIEYTQEQHRAWGKPRAEVAAWSPREGHGRRLSVAGSNVYCHWLDMAAYLKVCDHTDYAIKSL